MQRDKRDKARASFGQARPRGVLSRPEAELGRLQISGLVHDANRDDASADLSCDADGLHGATSKTGHQP
jgi:hypothetical protein